MSDTFNNSPPVQNIEQLLLQQIEVQQKVLEATERKVKAETEAAILSREAIAKHEEAILQAQLTKETHERLISSIEVLMDEVKLAVSLAEPLKQVIVKIDILIQVLQLLIQIINQLNGVSKEHLERLQEQLFRLAELNAMASKDITITQSSQTVGSVKSDQANIAENLSAIKKNLEEQNRDGF